MGAPHLFRNTNKLFAVPVYPGVIYCNFAMGQYLALNVSQKQFGL